MAKNTTNNRIPIKWIRDKAKAAYEKTSSCYICGSEEDLELHHLHSLTVLLNNWAARKKYDISTDDGILAVRDEFIAEHYSELYDQVYTLCNTHHVRLHGVYGKAPVLGSEAKQANWLKIQKAKIDSGETQKVATPVGSFSNFF